MRQGAYANNRAPGEGWRFASGFLPSQRVEELAAHETTVTLSDLEVYRFALTLANPGAQAGGCMAEVAFRFVDGPTVGATLAILGNREVIWQDGAAEVLDAASFTRYEPPQVRLTTRDSRLFDLVLDRGITRLADQNGNALAITDAGIAHSSGAAIAFTRDAAGRIAEIADPAGGVLRYGYDAAGDLVAVTDQLGNVTRFFYDARHLLTEIEDPLGRRPVRNEYDAAGRLVRQVDAFGKAVSFAHDLSARREVITDRLGYTRILGFDARGNVVEEIDQTGAVTRRTFDARDHLTSETDPLGRTTRYEYDAADNLLAEIDALGNQQRYSYDAGGRRSTSWSLSFARSSTASTSCTASFRPRIGRSSAENSARVRSSVRLGGAGTTSSTQGRWALLMGSSRAGPSR
ncbi:MAG: RHS repeat protein [Candidatus Schekmanbacteria bacterium]|nr:RHS repeat protein [Candidatus Schekmanbacteria bacterium]